MTTLSGALGGLFGRRPARDAGDEENANEQSQTGSTEAEGTIAEGSTGTTTGGRFDQGPVVVWQAPNKMEAEIVKGRLESEGIPAFLRGEAVGPIIGLTSGSLALTEVLVPFPLADQAMDILYESHNSVEQSFDEQNPE